MSTPSPGEAALTRAPIPYRTSPAVKQRLRPQRSVSLLAGIMRTAMINRNSVIAACTPVTVVSRSSVMSLIITFMFEPAKLQMNCASASGARNARRDRAGPSDAGFALKASSARGGRVRLQRRGAGGERQRRPDVGRGDLARGDRPHVVVALPP